MTTKYITKYVNEYGQVDTFSLLQKIEELYKFRLYRSCDNMINELYEICTGTIYDNINYDLFFLTFDEVCTLSIIIERLSQKLFFTTKFKQYYSCGQKPFSSFPLNSK